MKLQPYLRQNKLQGLTVRPEFVEGWAVKPIMVRQGSPERSRRAHHERLNLKRFSVNSKAQLFKLAALLLCCQSLSAEPPPVQSAQENFNEAADALNDPTAMTGKLEQGLAGVLLPTDKNVTPHPDSNANNGELIDPTRMNQNFREALKRVSPNNASASPGITTQSSVLPEIKLIASVCGMHKDQNHAMLRINDKTEMVSVGDKITAIENNQLIEIHVLEIDKGHVKVEVLPANETIILR